MSIIVVVKNPPMILNIRRTGDLTVMQVYLRLFAIKQKQIKYSKAFITNKMIYVDDDSAIIILIFFIDRKSVV